MAFDEKEQAILRWAVENGKSKQETLDAIIRYRTTGSPKDPSAPTPQPEEGGFLGEAGADVAETTSGILSQFKTTGEDIVKTSQDTGLNPLEKILRGASQAFRGGARVAGEAITGLGKLFLPQQAEEAVAGSVRGGIQYAVQNNEALQEVLKNYESLDPKTKGMVDSALGFAEGLSAVVGGGAAGTASRAALRAGETAAGTLSRAAKETVSELGSITETGAAGIQAATKATLDPAMIMQRVARINKSEQVKFQRLSGETVGQYLVKRGIFGNIDELTTQLFNRFQKSREAADRLFETLDERTGKLYQAPPVKTVVDELFEHEKAISTPGAKSKDLLRVAELKRKYDREGLSQAEINLVKRLYEKNVKVGYLKENKTDAVARATTLDTAIREWQRAQVEKLGATNLREINKETQLAKNLLDNLGKEYYGSMGNNAVTLTDWIIISELNPTAVASLLVKKGLSDKGVQAAIAKRIAGSPEEPDIFPIFQNAGTKIDSFGEWLKTIDPKTTK